MGLMSGFDERSMPAPCMQPWAMLGQVRCSPQGLWGAVGVRSSFLPHCPLPALLGLGYRCRPGTYRGSGLAGFTRGALETLRALWFNGGKKR